MTETLTITSNGSWGKFEDVMREEKRLESLKQVEYDACFSEEKPKDHKVIFFNQKDLEKNHDLKITYKYFRNGINN